MRHLQNVLFISLLDLYKYKKANFFQLIVKSIVIPRYFIQVGVPVLIKEYRNLFIFFVNISVKID